MAQQSELTAEQWLELAERFYAESLKFKRAGATAEECYKVTMYKRSAEAAERFAAQVNVEKKSVKS